MFDAISTNAATTQTPTFEALTEMMRKLQRPPKPLFDCIVCLPQHLRALKAEFQSSGDGTDHIYGFPVHVESNPIDAFGKALQLAGAGKRVALIRDKDGQMETCLIDLKSLTVPPSAFALSPTICDFEGFNDDRC